jgi:hypothetical protein
VSLGGEFGKGGGTASAGLGEVSGVYDLAHADQRLLQIPITGVDV